MRAVLSQDHHVEDARIDAIGKRKIDNAIFPCKRHGWLSALGSQGSQSRAFPTSQNHSASLHNISIELGALWGPRGMTLKGKISEIWLYFTRKKSYSNCA